VGLGRFGGGLRGEVGQEPGECSCVELFSAGSGDGDAAVGQRRHRQCPSDMDVSESAVANVSPVQCEFNQPARARPGRTLVEGGEE
jgi:hypothetical protein